MATGEHPITRSGLREALEHYQQKRTFKQL